MSLKPHPEYKDSGANWLGAVPTSWSISPLGHFFTERSQTVSDKDFQPLSVTMQGIVPQMENVAKTENGDNRKLVRKGDFVINSRSDRKGSSGVADRDGSVSVISIVLEPHGIVPQFVHHLLRSKPFQEEFYRFGTGIVADLWSTRFSSMKSIRLAVPSETEQNVIARYLDRETAEIDAFIADQEELIALLNERRAATITQAVTKGLDPTAPMKDSGVKWLGPIPRHWSVRGIKAAATTVGGSGFPHEYQGLEDEEIPFHKVSALAGAGPDGVIRNSRDTVSRATAKVLGAKILPSGTIVMAKIGAALLLGRMRSVDRPFCIDNNMLALVPHRGYVARYLTYALQIVSFDLIVNPGAVPSLDMTAFRDYPLAFPEQEEQQSIVEFIDRELGQIDAAMTDAREAIALSKERRAALISAAVTGKIDVRDAIVSKQQSLEGNFVVH